MQCFFCFFSLAITAFFYDNFRFFLFLFNFFFLKKNINWWIMVIDFFAIPRSDCPQ